MDAEPKAVFALWHFLFLAAFSEFRNKHSFSNKERDNWIWLPLREIVLPVESWFALGWLSLEGTGVSQSIWFNRSPLEFFPVFIAVGWRSVKVLSSEWTATSHIGVGGVSE